MATAKWSTPAALSSSLITTELDSLADAGESAVFTYDNSSNKDLYGAVTVKLGSLAVPSAGRSISLRVYMSDGTNVEDKSGTGDIYTKGLTYSTSAKIIIFPMVRLYPFSLRFSVINNAGVSFASSNNGVYIRPYNEDIS